MLECVPGELVRHAEPVIEELRRARLSIVTAESCTGGLVAATLSCVPHAGECLHGGFVAYSKQTKSSVLGVDPSLLSTAGSVNSTVAEQMAEGALQRSLATLSVSVTGVLGPGPDEDGIPQGLVYFCVKRRGGPSKIVAEQFTSEDPDDIRRSSIVTAMNLIREAAASTEPARMKA